MNGRFAPTAVILETPAFRRSRRDSTAALIGFTRGQRHVARSLVSKASRSIIEVVGFAPWCATPGHDDIVHERAVVVEVGAANEPGEQGLCALHGLHDEPLRQKRGTSRVQAFSS